MKDKIVKKKKDEAKFHQKEVPAFWRVEWDPQEVLMNHRGEPNASVSF